jgi:nitrogen regulatory protein P-II 1
VATGFYKKQGNHFPVFKNGHHGLVPLLPINGTSGILNKHRRGYLSGGIIMKLIKTIIKPERFEYIKKALENKGFISMTISEVRGRGEQKGISLEYRGGLMTVDMLPKIQIEIIIHEKDVDAVIGIITESARTGKIGDGKIFVIPVERAIRIRTGETEV